ncbi:transcription activator GAGA isoform X3 [Cherax quadricarinatus]|uniref:transcription activator GAGA isoform X3 n=1 Tax=Cherax quadricarinatus TaxID=27406 RepID=UPI00387E6401
MSCSEGNLDLFQGAEFACYRDLEKAIRAHSEATYIHWVKSDCKKVVTANQCLTRDTDQYESKFVYRYIKYKCKHGGVAAQSVASTGARPNQRSFKLNCPAKIYASVDRKKNCMIVKTFNDVHNHGASRELFEHYPSHRRLNDAQEEAVRDRPRKKVNVIYPQDYVRFKPSDQQLLLSPVYQASPEVKLDDTTKDTDYGLPSQDIHGSGEFSHNNGEDVPVAVSPEQYLAEQSEREPTPPPPTPTPQKPESYQLRHNNHLTIVLEALARDESFMDVTLTAQGRSLKAHKSVLSAVSPYFRGVLRDNPCQHPIIIMPRDVRFEELFSIVNYIYKGEMTVAAEDLTSLLKTAEILQVSGLAPSDSSATVNPHTDCSTAGNVRSSSASSSSSSSNLASASRPSRTVKTSSHQTSTPPARPKSRDSMINPTDFMDVDMTCVKEEVQSADEEENEEQITKDSSSQPPGKLDPTFQQNLSTFSPSYDPLDHPTTSTSSVHDTSPALPVKSDPDVTADINVIAEDPHPFTCPHCQEHHREMDTLVTHLRVRHPSKASFTCGCGRVYTRQMYHQAHARVCSNTS